VCGGVRYMGMNFLFRSLPSSPSPLSLPGDSLGYGNRPTKRSKDWEGAGTRTERSPIGGGSVCVRVGIPGGLSLSFPFLSYFSPPFGRAIGVCA
jgi:hypothetical protein